MATSTVEDYLKVILLRSGEADALVPMGEVAVGLGVVPGTATTMIKTLAERGLIEHTPRQGVRLTLEGRREATAVLRRHRLIETFLVSVLKMDWSEVHVEAERLEHAVSERVLERIDALLSYPRNDPHGDPIPDAAGQFPSRKTATLMKAPLGVELNIVRILDQSPGFLQFAEAAGLIPEVRLTVFERNETAGVVSVDIRGRQRLTLGVAQAQLIQVSGDTET